MRVSVCGGGGSEDGALGYGGQEAWGPGRVCCVVFVSEAVK